MSLTGSVKNPWNYCKCSANRRPSTSQRTTRQQKHGRKIAAQLHYWFSFFLSYNWIGECIGSTHSWTDGRPIIVAVPHTLPVSRTSELRTFCASTHLSLKITSARRAAGAWGRCPIHNDVTHRRPRNVRRQRCAGARVQYGV